MLLPVGAHLLLLRYFGPYVVIFINVYYFNRRHGMVIICCKGFWALRHSIIRVVAFSKLLRKAYFVIIWR